jgi:hypothetical protein
MCVRCAFSICLRYLLIAILIASEPWPTTTRSSVVLSAPAYHTSILTMPSPLVEEFVMHAPRTICRCATPSLVSR